MTQATRRADASGTTTRRVERVFAGMPTSEGAGVRLTRLIGRPGLPDLDPFLMLDEFRSDTASDYLAGFPDHPHRGFETVTYMLAGRMRHGDNQGNSGLLRPGSVQWMTAGRGIVHSEMPEQEDGLMWGFQLWVNLPAADKMTAPRYQNIEPETIPVLDRADGVRIKVIAGRVDGVDGAVQAVATDPTYLDVSLPAGTSFTHVVPTDYAAFVYPFEGSIRVGDGESLKRGELGVLGSGDAITISADGTGAARALLVAGRSLREPIAKYGPFVMNTEAQIVQAIQDYNAGRF
ncbi:pirin family protein [Reyranella sp. CPCC 100927]|uniref:pirin family protein n=1 Tax=Reyranella sp. CPCC 100927 TaxID=2599616 RepID=UPI0011B3F275|nr:pirin family protein [Reyranella sp. CPCC 100927]TWT02840.1 pirin family protein [Reyranella sp. CPCC 100927]